MQVFISYAREDEAIASRLYRDLELHGANPWLDQEKILAGEDWERTIYEAIKNSSYFIALISKHSVGKRGFVQKELRKALDLLDEFPPESIFVIPVRLDQSEPQHDQLSRLHRVDLFVSYDDGLARICKAMGLQLPVSPSDKQSRSPNLRPGVARDIPDDILILIREQANAEYPDDDPARRYEIKHQVQAWHQMQSFQPENLPEEVRTGIIKLSQQQHPSDFSTQLDFARDQVYAWRHLKVLAPGDVPPEIVEEIKKFASDLHPDDYAKQILSFQNQLAKWKTLTH